MEKKKRRDKDNQHNMKRAQEMAYGADFKAADRAYERAKRK